MTGPEGRPIVPRWAGLLAPALLYASALLLPAGKDEGPPRTGLEYLALGGYMFAGFLFVPANVFFVAGWAGQAAGRRTVPVVCGLIALGFAAVGVIPVLDLGVLGYPAYWVWVSSFAALVLAAGLSRRPTSPPEPRA